MIRAKKHFGQNFLQDNYYLDKIIQAIPVGNSNTILEIGPGLGDLTERLLQKKEVISIEVDEDLYKILVSKFEPEISSGKLKLILGDALSELEHGSNMPNKYDLVANLPYYVATNIVLKALFDDKCQNVLVLVQKEVAKKFCAQSGSSEYGAISVLADLCGQRYLLFDIPASAFKPAPKIISSVMLIKKESIQHDLLVSVSKLLRIAFAAPRKILFKNLSSVYDKELISAAFVDLGIDRDKRPHEISSEIYIKLIGYLK
jgi:16S rRNA (adenine1518-N6/adenine1519-N6)-dimethyltransferase